MAVSPVNTRAEADFKKPKNFPEIKKRDKFSIFREMLQFFGFSSNFWESKFKGFKPDIDSFAVLMLVQSNLIPIIILVLIEIIFSWFADKKLVVE